MTDPLDRLLDQARVPPTPAGLADRIVAHATAQPQQAPAVPPRRGDRRGAWLRRPRTLAAFVGANLLVASAVAATLSGGLKLPPLREVPVIAPVLAAIAPAHPPKPVRHHAVVPPAPRSTPEPQAVQAPVVRQPPPRIERMLARGDRLAERIAAREAAGLPVPPRARTRLELHQLERQAVDQWQKGERVAPELRDRIARERFELAPPAMKARIAERVEARRAAGKPVPPSLDAIVPKAEPAIPETQSLAPFADPVPAAPALLKERRLQRWRTLTPAQRQMLIERMRARRAARQQLRP